MRTSVRRGLSAFAIAGGFVLLGVATAETATAETKDPGITPGSTTGDDGVGSGNQTGVELHVPLDASDNQVTVIGDRNRSDGSQGDPPVEAAPSAEYGSTSGEDGAGSGNQTAVEVEAPLDASGNQVTVIGDGNRSSGGSDGAGDSGPGAGSGPVGTTSGEDGAGSGNQSAVAVCAPVDASGNQVTVIGDGNRSSGGSGGSPSCESDAPGSGSTSGEDGALSGNQTGVDADAPVDASGNQVTVIGDGNRSSGGSGAADGDGGSEGGTTSGQDGVGSGNQTPLRLMAPLDASDNQVTLVGDDNTSGGEAAGGHDGTPGGGSGGTGEESGDGPGDGSGDGPNGEAADRADGDDVRTAGEQADSGSQPADVRGAESRTGAAVLPRAPFTATVPSAVAAGVVPDAFRAPPAALSFGAIPALLLAGAACLLLVRRRIED